MRFDSAIYSPGNPWFIGETPLSFLVLNFDQTFVGRSILIPKAAAPDLESLVDEEVGPLMLEVAAVGRHIKAAFGAERMNYASLGNVVAQLHWHLIPRYENDINYGAPPWPVAEPRTPTDDEQHTTIRRIREGFPGKLLN